MPAGLKRFQKAELPGIRSQLSPLTLQVHLTGLGGEQVTELTGSGAVQHTNVFIGGKLQATYDFTSGSGNGLHFALADMLGTKRVQVTPTGVGTGNVELQCMSLPFGNGLGNPRVTNCVGSGPDATEHHYTGKERDTESGNDYFGARYYASSVGRFMSPDWAAQEEPVPYAELDDPQSLNLYAYVRNNPLTRVDEDGHAPMSWGGFQNCASNNSNDDCQRQHNAEAGYGQMTDAELSKREGEQRQWLINNATSDAAKDLASKADGPTVFHLYMCVNFGDCGKTSYDSSIIHLVNSPGVKAAVQAAATVLTGLPSGAIKLRGNQGFRDEDGNIWKKDQLHKDHWDVSDKNGKKIKEVDFNGRQIWPDGPKNKNK